MHVLNQTNVQGLQKGIHANKHTTVTHHKHTLVMHVVFCDNRKPLAAHVQRVLVERIVVAVCAWRSPVYEN